MVVILRLKGRIASPERTADCFVEHHDAHVEEELQRPSVPSRLLLLDHALRQDLVDRTLDEGGRDRQAVMPAPAHILLARDGWHEDIRSDRQYSIGRQLRRARDESQTSSSLRRSPLGTSGKARTL